MSTLIIQPPSALLLEHCEILDKLIASFLDQRSRIPAEAGIYESTIESLNLFFIAIRCIEGVAVLARQDMILFYPSNNAARCALEAATRALWLVNEDNVFQREAKWIIHLKSEETYLASQSALCEAVGFSSDAEQTRLANVQSFRTNVEQALLAKGISTIGRIPDMRSSLLSIGHENMYVFYKLLCQTSHASHYATKNYRKNGLGSQKVFQDAADANDWIPSMSTCLFVLKDVGPRIIDRLAACDYRI